MRNSITRLAVVLAAAFAFASAAEARPLVKVRVGAPAVVVAPPTVLVAPRPVYVRPMAPGPNYVWVEPHWRHDAYGRRVYIAGHWAHRPRAVMMRPPPRIVHRY